MKGIIKKVDIAGGYGFITIEGKEDMFFHANDCTNQDFKEMAAGDMVSFEEGTSDRGPKAVNVVLAEEAAA